MSEQTTGLAVISPLLDTSINTVSKNIVQQVVNGEVNAVEAHMAVKWLESLAKEITENKEYKSAVLAGIEKQVEGNKRSITYKDHTVAIRATSTYYDFEATKDPLWQEWKDIETRAKEALKKREDELKAGWDEKSFNIQVKTVLIEKLPTLNMEEVMQDYRIYPPVKHQKDGPVVTFKK